MKGWLIGFSMTPVCDPFFELRVLREIILEGLDTAPQDL
jgi:hypothetical protein